MPYDSPIRNALRWPDYIVCKNDKLKSRKVFFHSGSLTSELSLKITTRMARRIEQHHARRQYVSFSFYSFNHCYNQFTHCWQMKLSLRFNTSSKTRTRYPISVTVIITKWQWPRSSGKQSKSTKLDSKLAGWQQSTLR